MRRHLQVVALAILAISIACNISDRTVGPNSKELSVVSTVVPPTNNSACTVHWANGVNGSWFDASKWNPAGVPGASSSVCIDAAGTYTVTLDPPVDSIPAPVLAISVGGSGAVPTLNIGGDNGRINVTEGVAIGSGATLQFSGTGSTLTAAGTITNNGSLKVTAGCGGCGGATISADIINTGTILIAGGPTLTLSKVNGAYQNTGNVTFGGFIVIPATAGNATFSQEGGLYGGAANFETFTMRSGTFRLSGGKIRPRLNLLPIVVLDGASLVVDSTALDSVTVAVRGRTDAVPTITGNFRPLTTLWIAGASNGGNGTVELVGNPVNYGTMRVTRFMDASGGITVTGSGRLTNAGTLNNTDANRDTLFYSIDLTNTGTINAIGQSSIVLRKPGGSYENSGLIDLQAGISVLGIESGGTFTNTSPGTITNGAVVVDGNSHLRGTGTLTTIVIPQNGGAIDPGTSPGLFTFKQFRMPSTGLLNIELGGLTPVTQYDRLVVTELAGFAGTLNISEINGFQSGLCGQVFDVAYAPSAGAGMFPTINGLNPAPGRMLRAMMVGQTATTPAIIRLVGFDPGLKVCAGPPSVSLTEGGPSLQYAVALRDAPTSTVIVKAAGDAQVSAPDSAVFTTSNWQTPQILNVTAIDDAVYEGTHTGGVTHTVRSLDAAYNGIAAGSITATITDNDAPPLVPTTVNVTIDSSSIEVGHTAQASAVVRDQNGNTMAGETVTWSSNTPSFASVSASGVVTAIAAGTAVIKATDGSVSGTASVTVTAPPPPPAVVTSISVSIDSTSLQEGHTAQGSATVRDQYGAVMSGQTITWSTDTPLRVSVSNLGIVTAISAGSASIRATVGSVSNTASLTITSPPPPPLVVTTISVSIDSSSLQVGHTAQATATVRDQYGAVISGQSVTWSSNTPSLATVSAAGVVTGVAEGSAVIKATIGSVFGTGSLAINPLPPPPPVVTTVSVSIDSASLQVGHTAHATATVRDQYSNVMNGQSITWSSDTPGFAGVSSTGVVTAIAAGNATIRATVGSVFGTASLTITPIPPAPPAATTITVVIDSSSLQVGNTAQATTTVRDQYGAVMSGQTVTWSSNTPSLASVSSIGLVTGIAEGAAVIKAALGGVSGTASLNITAPPPPNHPIPTTISVSIDSASLRVGNSAQATATVRDQFGNIMSGESVTWSSLSSTVASVSPAGVVIGVAAGTAEIRATAGNAIGSSSIQVYAAPPPPPSVTRIFISAEFGQATLPGDSMQLIAYVIYADGSYLRDANVQWKSLTPKIVSISRTGLVKLLQPGAGMVQATYGVLTDTRPVPVIGAPVPTSLGLALPSLTIGDTALVRAFVFDQYKHVIPDVKLTWELLTPKTASISSRDCEGYSCIMLTAKAAGTVRIRIAFGKLRLEADGNVSSGIFKVFEGTVGRSQKYTINYWPGCAWDVWVENTQMSSDWRQSPAVTVTDVKATARIEAVGGKCPQAPFAAALQYRSFRVDDSGADVVLDDVLSYPYVQARFRTTSFTKTGLSGVLTFSFVNVGGRNFEISENIDLK